MCLSDVDCPGNLACYSGNVAWAPALLVNGSFCDCSLRYGHIRETQTDEFCTLLGAQAVCSLIIETFLIVTAGLLWLHGSLTLLGLKLQNQFVWNDTSVTALTIVLAISTFMAMLFAELMSLVQPRLQTVIIAGRKASTLEDYELILIGLTNFVGTVALSNVPLIWISIVLRSKSFSITSQQASRVKTGVRIFQGVVACGVIASIFTGGNVGLFLAGGIIFVGQGGVIMIFVVARRWLKGMIVEQFSAKDVAGQLLRRIDWLTRTVLCCIIPASLLSGLYGMVNFLGLENFCEVGSLCIDIMTLLTMFVLILVAQAACAYYCRLSLGLAHPLSFKVANGDSNEHVRLSVKNGDSGDESISLEKKI